MLTVVEDAAAREELTAGLDELVREGARRMLAAGLEAEVGLNWRRIARRWTRPVGGWWSATGTPGRGR